MLLGDEHPPLGQIEGSFSCLFTLLSLNIGLKEV